MRVHAIESGRLLGNRTFLRATGWSALARRAEPYEFPVLSYVVEHPDGLVAIDTGLGMPVRVPRMQRRFVPQPVPGSVRGIAAGMREAGLAPEDVRTVVLTHLDWDHADGLAALPHAEVLVHRPELAFASRVLGRVRYQPRRWPANFAPTAYDLDPEPCGPFPESRAITPDGAIRVVPLPGHSIGQVGVVLRADDATLLLPGDHMLRQDWFLEDLRAGRLLGLGLFYPEPARETSRRIARLLRETSTVLLPSHDADAPARLAAWVSADAPAEGAAAAVRASAGA